MEPLLRELGRRVRRARTEKSWTLRDLAAASQLSTRFLTQLEGGRGNISVLKLARVAASLGTSPDHLLRAPRRSVALVGMRGAGKSTVGALVARKMRLPFFEVDREVEARAGLSLAELFSLHGEEYYRRLERAALRELLERPEVRRGGAVLSTGGSLVTDPETYTLLKDHALTVWLRARPEEHFARVLAQGDRRPMAGRADALADLRRLLDARELLYREADLTVDTSDVAAGIVAATIREAIDGKR